MSKKRRTTEMLDRWGIYGEPMKVYSLPVIVAGSVDEDHFEVFTRNPDGRRSVHYEGPDGMEAEATADLLALAKVPAEVANG